MALTNEAFDDAGITRTQTDGALALSPDTLDAPGVGTSTQAPGTQPNDILDPGFDLTLRPMRYPQFFDMYRDAIKNTWTVDEIDFSTDLDDLDRKITPAERHLVNRLVAFFATGDYRGQQPGAQPLQAHQCP